MWAFYADIGCGDGRGDHTHHSTYKRLLGDFMDENPGLLVLIFDLGVDPKHWSSAWNVAAKGYGGDETEPGSTQHWIREMTDKLKEAGAYGRIPEELWESSGRSVHRILMGGALRPTNPAPTPLPTPTDEELRG